MSVFIGIDPGIQGAVCLMHGDGRIQLTDTPVAKAKVGYEYLVSAMRRLIDLGDNPGPLFGALEQGVAIVRGGGGRGVFPNAKAVRGAGLWEGILVGLEIPYELVPPSKWKKAMSIPDGAPKSEVLIIAQRLFPQAAVDLQRVKDHGRAEALLLAEYARRRASGA